MQKDLDTPIQYLKGIGPKKAKIFHKMGLFTVEDILYFFPRRYEDRRNFLSVSKVKAEEFVTLNVEVLARAKRKSLKNKRIEILEVAVGDQTGKIFCVWFNQPYLYDYFKVGRRIILYGKPQEYQGRLQLVAPEFEIIEEEELSTSLNIGRITPIYSLVEGISQRWFRSIVRSVLDQYITKIEDFLPYDIRARNNLLNLAVALLNIHFPQDFSLKEQAYERLCFEEFFLFQVPLALRKLRRKTKQGIAHSINEEIINKFIESLPFKLTCSQEKVWEEIKLDMQSPLPMQRLLQGDTGSGKTIVAILSSLIAVSGNYQVAFMVPTEVLARQHYERIKELFLKCSLTKDIKIALITSSLKGSQRKELYQAIKNGEVLLIVGTHALLEEELQFKNLGLVIIDEQHKFGVSQRALLPQKGKNPDVLIMTATPIPRTLAITLYGDLDISVIKELPPGRKFPKTLYFPFSDRQKAYNFVREQLKNGRQAYVICPVIDETNKMQLKGVKQVFEELKRKELKDFKLGLIHGKLSSSEQLKIMQDFLEKKIDVLVSTTILEVGIDVPNATCIIIEFAERFGLSQLHQLRGRVSRSEEESYCILISDLPSEQARERINSLLKFDDGFRIAEADLRIRGPGEFFGQRQHGHNVGELKLGNPILQMHILKKAREEAIRLIQRDSGLSLRINQPLREKLLKRFPDYEKLMVVG